MIFSYYFDRAKQHRVEFIFQLLDQQVEDHGDVAILFNARILEIKDGLELRNEFKLGNFTFAAGNTAHDIDFHRIHIADQRKWVFEIKNNKKADQNVVVGIIAKELNGNPIGMDIIQESKSYDAALRANNLAVIEDSYVPPEITQTIVFTTFETPETPVGFASKTGVYLPGVKHYEVKEFVYTLPEAIEANTKFSIEMNVAPVFVDPAKDTIFELIIDGVGVLTLQKTNLMYLKHEVDPSLAVRIPFVAPLIPDTFYSNGFTSASKVEISGDGQGVLTIKYADKQMAGEYAASNPITFIELLSRERPAAITLKAFADKYTDDVALQQEVIASGTRTGIVDEWHMNNVNDGSELTAWASDVTGIEASGAASIGVRFTKERVIKKLTFVQSAEYGSDRVSVIAFNDGQPSEEVTTRATLSQGYVEIEIEQDVSAQNWMIISETPIVSFPDDGRLLEERVLNESWIVYDLKMFEAAPDAVLNPSYTITEEGDAIITWGYTDLTDVTFSLYNHGEPTGYSIAGKTSITMTNLDRDVEYEIQVVAVREGSESFPSAPMYFTVGQRQMDWTKVIPVKLDNLSVKFHK